MFQSMVLVGALIAAGAGAGRKDRVPDAKVNAAVAALAGKYGEAERPRIDVRVSRARVGLRGEQLPWIDATGVETRCGARHP